MIDRTDHITELKQRIAELEREVSLLKGALQFEKQRADGLGADIVAVENIVLNEPDSSIAIADILGVLRTYLGRMQEKVLEVNNDD